VVVKDFLEEKCLLPQNIQTPDIYAIIGSGEPLHTALRNIQILRHAGYSVEYPIRDLGFGKQFKAANESGARWAIIFGEEEVSAGNAKMKNLRSGEETELALDRLVEGVRGLEET